MYNKTTTFIAKTDLSGKMGYGVKMLAEMSGKLPFVQLAGEGEEIEGVIVEPAKANEAVTVMLNGDFALVMLGEAVTVGDAVGVTSEGKFKKVTTGKVAGKAYQSGKAGEFVKVLLDRSEIAAG